MSLREDSLRLRAGTAMRMIDRRWRSDCRVQIADFRFSVPSISNPIWSLPS